MRKRMVGGSLRRLREARGLSIEYVADELGASRSAIYRQETGHTATSVADARAYLSLYQVEDEKTIERVMSLARASRTRGWWVAYGPKAGEQHVDVAEAEDFSTEIRILTLNCIHALLETDEYAEAAMASIRGMLHMEDIDLDASFKLRRLRREILNRDEAPTLWCVIGEAALYVEFPDKGVMQRQIEHLLKLSERPSISLQILPMSSIASQTMEGFMSIMSVDGTVDGSVAHKTNAFIDDPDQVKKDIYHFTHMQTQALSRNESRALLLRIADSMRSN